MRKLITSPQGALSVITEEACLMPMQRWKSRGKVGLVYSIYTSSTRLASLLLPYANSNPDTVLNSTQSIHAQMYELLLDMPVLFYR